MIAQIIALVSGAPELTGDWIDGFPDTVADAGSIDFDKLAFRGVFQDVGAVKLLRMGVGVVHIGAGANGDEHVPAVFGEDDIASPVTSAGELGIAGDVGNDRLGGRT